MNKITVGIPAFNEEKNIAAIIIGLKKITDKIIVCNDGSTDSTGEIAKELGAIVINHEKNLGYGAGIKSIFLKAKEMKSEIIEHKNYIGGRYSVLSEVGMLPAQLLGLNEENLKDLII